MNKPFRTAMLAHAVLLALGARSFAAPEWVDRGLTLRQLGLSLDAGLGLAHVTGPPEATGAGVNLEGAFGLLDDLEIGVRSGLRIGDRQAKATQADAAARLFDLETYGTGRDLFANPEIRLLGRALDLSAVELGVEGRAFLPFEAGTRFSFMFGVPVRLHFARLVRIDTGVYVPVIFYGNGDGTTGNAVTINVPVEAWFQVAPTLFLGPLAELRLNDNAGSLGADRASGLLLGFGLGYRISRFADVKADFLFPRVNAGPDFGAGAGMGLHFD
jgi:hypothetical protein